MKYRKKPVEVEAFCWTGQVSSVWPDWAFQMALGSQIQRLMIQTLSSGDWIVRGANGEMYSVKPDVFEATYAPVPEPPPSEGKPQTNLEHLRAITAKLLTTANAAKAPGDPRPYGHDPAEIQRLIRETIGYLRVSLHDGTDLAGRQYALEAWERFRMENLACGSCCPLVQDSKAAQDALRLALKDMERQVLEAEQNAATLRGNLRHEFEETDRVRNKLVEVEARLAEQTRAAEAMAKLAEEKKEGPKP